MDSLLKNLIKLIFKDDYNKFNEMIKYIEQYNQYNKYFIERHYHSNFEYSKMPRPIVSFLIGSTIYL